MKKFNLRFLHLSLMLGLAVCGTAVASAQTNETADAPRVLAPAASTDFVGALSSNTVKLSTTGETSFVAFQMDFEVPTTVTAADLTAASSVNGMELASNLIVGETKNIYRVLGYTMTNTNFTVNAAELFSVKFTSSASLAVEDIALTNILIVKTEDIAKDVEQTGSVENGTIAGDVNGDGTIDVQDVLAIIAVSSGSTEQFKEYADVNGDGSYDVQDVIAVIELSK